VYPVVVWITYSLVVVLLWPYLTNLTKTDHQVVSITKEK